jgi:predicted dehydrogenase
MSTFKFGLIGAGGIAQAYSAAIQSMPTASLVAIADSNLEAAQKMAAEHDAKVFDSFESLAGDAEVDAVIVCTPPLFHEAHCCAFLEKGVHVLCEKPLSINSASAVAMLNAAKKGNAVFTMASKFRFVDDVTDAKEFVESGKLGDIILYENCFSGKVDMTKRWNSNPEVSGGGVLIDNGTHSLDIMRYLLGNLREIRVVEGIRVQSMSVEDTVHVFVRAESGAMGCIDLSWSLHKPSDYFISLYGTEGTLQIGWRGSRYKLNDDKDWTTFGTGYDKIGAFRNQLTNFVGAIQNGEELIIKPEDGVASVCTVEAAYEALERGDWEPVKFETVLSKVN